MNAKTDELIQKYVAHGGDPQEWWREWRGSYSIALTDPASIVRNRGERRTLELVRWDWRKPQNMRPGAPVINARMEKLTSPFWAARVLGRQGHRSHARLLRVDRRQRRQDPALPSR